MHFCSSHVRTLEYVLRIENRDRFGDLGLRYARMMASRRTKLLFVSAGLLYLLLALWLLKTAFTKGARVIKN